MKKIIIALLAGVLSACATQPTQIASTEAAAPAPTATPAATTVALGYYTGTQASFDAVRAYNAYLDIVSADVYSVQLDGSIVGSDDLDVLTYNREHGIQTLACISNYNIDPDVGEFDTELARAAIVTYPDAFIADAVDLAVNGGYDGVNIDFENIGFSDLSADRAAFSAFIHRLAGELHARGLKLVISVPGKTGDDMDDQWNYPYDLVALGQDADYLQLMTYDQHGPWSDPGPVSGADWVEACLAYATSQVGPSKLLIGLPAYGYDWDLTESNPEQWQYVAGGFSWTDISTLNEQPGAEIRWDDASQTPFVTYTLDGHDHQAWYENPESIRIKSALVAKYQLGGLSMWSLGQEDEAFWQAAVEGMVSVTP